MNQFLKNAQAFDMEAVLNAEEAKVESFNSTLEYTRPLGEYPTVSEIVNFLQNRKRNIHVYTDDIRSNGIVVQDDMRKYLESPNLSSGTIKKALNTMLHYEFEKNCRKKLEALQGEKDHFKLGTYLHECVLEPTKFSRVIVEPKASRANNSDLDMLCDFWEETIRDKGEVFPEGSAPIQAEEAIEKAYKDTVKDIDKRDGKKEYLNNLIQISGLRVVSEDMKMIIDIAHSNYMRYGNGILPELLKHSKREISMYVKDEETGLDVKIRPDAIQFAENIGVDAIISVKTTSCETLGHFYYHSAKLNYETSEGMYQEVASKATGRDFATTLMIMIQTVPPYGVALLKWNPEDIEIGKHKYRHALQSIADADFSKVVPSFDMYAEQGHFGIIEMKQPDWNKKNIHPVDVND